MMENSRGDKWEMLGRLKMAVKKVKFLLNFNLNRWRIASILGRTTTSLPRRRTLSFNDRPGLRSYASNDYDDDAYRYGAQISSDHNQSNSFSSRESPNSVGRQIQRTTSCPSEDDIDKRAEMFIANFRRQLQMERQVSLELRYSNRANSFEDHDF